MVDAARNPAPSDPATDRNEVTSGEPHPIDFDKEGSVRLPATYLADGHLEHGYARTSYLAQGATHGTGRYHPTDTSGIEEGYVALTRARHQTRIYVVEGEATVDDEASHGRSEPRDASLDTVTDAMFRRSTNTTAYAHDPSASRVEDLAQRSTPAELQLQRRRLEHLLAACPPDLSQELAGARRQRDQLATTRRRPWVGRALDKAEAVLTDLETRQAAHDQFRADHADDYEAVNVLSRADQRPPSPGHQRHPPEPRPPPLTTVTHLRRRARPGHRRRVNTSATS